MSFEQAKATMLKHGYVRADVDLAIKLAEHAANEAVAAMGRVSGTAPNDMERVVFYLAARIFADNVPGGIMDGVKRDMQERRRG